MGKAMYLYNISKPFAISAADSNIDRHIEGKINFLLELLPPGTKHVATNNIDIPISVDMTLCVVLVFEHPWFTQDTKIKLDFSRESYKKDDGSVKQFQLFQGVRYIALEKNKLT